MFKLLTGTVYFFFSTELMRMVTTTVSCRIQSEKGRCKMCTLNSVNNDDYTNIPGKLGLFCQHSAEKSD